MSKARSRGLSHARTGSFVVTLALATTYWACTGAEKAGPAYGTTTTGFSLVWSTHGTSSATGDSRSAVDDSSVYAMDIDHVVWAVNKLTGAVRWRTQLTYGFDTGLLQGFGMTVAGGRVVVGDIDVFGLDPRTGAIAWRFTTPLPGERTGTGHLTSDGTTVFAGSKWGNLYAIDAATGAARWTTHVVADSNFSVNDPQLVDGTVYVGLSLSGGNFGGGAAAVNASDGRLVWSTLTPIDLHIPTGSRGVGVSPTLVVVGTGNGAVYGLDRQTGVVKLTLPVTTFLSPGEEQVGEKLYTVRGPGSTIYIGTTNGLVVALDGADLHVLWKTRVGLSVLDGIAAGNRFYVVSGDLYVLEASTGAIVWIARESDFWNEARTQSELFVSAPSLDSTHVYMAGDQGVYQFAKK